MTAALHRRAALAFAALMAFAIALMVVRVWWRFGSDTFFGDWLYNGVILGCAVLAAWRALALPGNRAAWLLIALGIASWFAGDIWWVIHEEDDVVPIPSLADWLYFGMYAPFAIAIVLLARERIGSASRMLALDGLIGAFAWARCRPRSCSSRCSRRPRATRSRWPSRSPTRSSTSS